MNQRTYARYCSRPEETRRWNTSLDCSGVGSSASVPLRDIHQQPELSRGAPEWIFGGSPRSGKGRRDKIQLQLSLNRVALCLSVHL